MYKNRLYVPNYVDLRKEMMEELHQMTYSVYPRYQKTIKVAMKLYFLLRMKKDVANYIARCKKCQQVKVDHQHLARLLHLLAIGEWKWEVISMDFITIFPMKTRKHDSIMVMLDKMCKTTHFILVKSTHKTSDIARIFMK